MVADGSEARMQRHSPVHDAETMEDTGGEATDELTAGTRFGRYQIRKLIGRGAFGAVYEAMQVEPLQRTVALKVLHDVARANPQLVGRFVREAQIAASITHPHICTVFDIGSEEGVPFIAMERLQGEGLDDRLERQRVLSPMVTADALIPVLSAVAAVHDAGIVHRDLKPANIFLATPRPGAVVPKLLDFGIVKVLDRDANVARTETRTFLGTPHYTSPEQAMDASAIDVRSDQWSLGVILYECLTGARPWREGPVLQILFEITTADIAPPSSRRGGIPPELDAVVMRALSRDRAHRFPSVRALAGALLPFASEGVQAAWREEFLPHAATAVHVTRALDTRVGPDSRASADALLRTEPQLEPDPAALARPVTAASRVGSPRPRYSDLQPAPAPAPVPRRLAGPAVAVAVAAALLAIVAALALRPSPAPREAPPPVTPVVAPEPAALDPAPPPEPDPAPVPEALAPVAAPSPPTVPAPPAPPPPPPEPARVHPRSRHRPTHPSGGAAPAPTAPAGGIPNV
jgi:serine/threonine-protein kinase